MNNESQIVLYQPDDSIRLEVKIDAGNETVWLNRNQIAELFGRDVKTIGKHINNALREELATETETNVSDVNNPKNPTVAKFATVQIEGGREVTRQVEYYNLDVILSVGYRVKSNRGIQFRRWSNTILKQYLLQGYSINRHLVAPPPPPADLRPQRGRTSSLSHLQSVRTVRISAHAHESES